MICPGSLAIGPLDRSRRIENLRNHTDHITRRLCSSGFVRGQRSPTAQRRHVLTAKYDHIIVGRHGRLSPPDGFATVGGGPAGHWPARSRRGCQGAPRAAAEMPPPGRTVPAGLPSPVSSSLVGGSRDWRAQMFDPAGFRPRECNPAWRHPPPEDRPRRRRVGDVVVLEILAAESLALLDLDQTGASEKSVRHGA